MPAPLLLWNPKNEAELVDLVHVKGLSRREAARVLGTTKNAVIGRLRYIAERGSAPAPHPGEKTTRQKGLQDPRPVPFRPGNTTAVHPFARRLFKAMNAEWCTMDEMVERSGVSRTTIWRWHTTTPNIVHLEACLNVVGLTMKVVEKDDG